jgi:hypothetical protein
MDRNEALRLLRGGEEGVKEWNRRREMGEKKPRLSDIIHSEGNCIIANLMSANLGGVNLSGVSLNAAMLYHAKLDDAKLRNAKFHEASFINASLSNADLSGADLSGADFTRASLLGADLSGADLRRANFTGARLISTNLRGTELTATSFNSATFSDTDLSEAICRTTAFANTDLSKVMGLESVRHLGPSTIGTNSLIRSRGQIPEFFLRGCGLTPWEVLSTRLYDPALTPPQFAELQYRIFDAWTKGRSMINGCFISYSWTDEKFVEKLRDRLIAEGVNVWLDRHDMIAGTIQDQVWQAIRVHDVALLVLSESSVKSDWVENELDMARAKEKAEKRAVLCPVALDDAWKAKVDAKGGPGDPSRQLWRTLTQKLVVDFSGWKTKAFEEAFQKLVRGLKVNYGPGATGTAVPPPSGP